MVMIKSAGLLLAVLCLSSYYTTEATSVSDAEWNAYKTELKKTYATTALENTARYNYAYNKAYIDAHNKKAAAGTYTYTLKAGPFTDMRLATFKTSFPKTTAATESFASPAPQANQIYTAPVDLIGTTGVQVADQGTVCNSGWAYATAKALELYAQLQNKALTLPISAQTYIDCAGGSRSCSNQIPQTAFDFISLYSQILLSTDEYPLKPTAGVGSCLYPSTITSTLRLAEYARVLDGFDEPMRQYVASGYPVVVEIDPTSFEFMNYGAGIFQQPATYGGSHFVVVVGYGTDEETGLDYWKLMNSFGPIWGEDGYMRILRDVAKSITKSAIFPSKFV